jgi:hypothetical protein
MQKKIYEFVGGCTIDLKDIADDFLAKNPLKAEFSFFITSIKFMKFCLKLNA